MKHIATQAGGLLRHFLKSEASGGIVLLGCTIVSMVVANSPFGQGYLELWKFPVGPYTTSLWINDGLMAIFFLLVGLELKREIRVGELSDLKVALLPIFAAAGGVLVPASIHLILNFGKETVAGIGIPMATDIAFAIGVLSLLGRRIPLSLKIFLTALAVVDDLIAIMVIAVFYTSALHVLNLAVSLGIFGLLLVFNRLGVKHLAIYLIFGVAMWYFMHESGVHATIAGVLLAFTIPFGDGRPGTLSYELQHVLHLPVAFFILPVFALANTAILLPEGWLSGMTTPNAIGIMLGLFIGKPVGILFFSLLATRLGLCTFPSEFNWRLVLGVGFLGGIGFTMSIFITLLAFDSLTLQDQSKMSVLMASTSSAVCGLLWLWIHTQSRKHKVRADRRLEQRVSA